MRVESRTRDIVDAWTDNTGMTQERLVGAVLDWWAKLDEVIQRQALIGLSDDDILKRAAAIRRQRDEIRGVDLIEQARHDAAVEAALAEQRAAHPPKAG